jgi:hypothetical protein
MAKKIAARRDSRNITPWYRESRRGGRRSRTGEMKPWPPSRARQPAPPSTCVCARSSRRLALVQDSVPLTSDFFAAREGSFSGRVSKPLGRSSRSALGSPWPLRPQQPVGLVALLGCFWLRPTGCPVVRLGRAGRRGQPTNRAGLRGFPVGIGQPKTDAPNGLHEGGGVAQLVAQPFDVRVHSPACDVRVIALRVPIW